MYHEFILNRIVIFSHECSAVQPIDQVIPSDLYPYRDEQGESVLCVECQWTGTKGSLKLVVSGVRNRSVYSGTRE